MPGCASCVTVSLRWRCSIVISELGVAVLATAMERLALTIAALSAICLVLLARRRKARSPSIPQSIHTETLVLSLGCTCLTAHVLGKWGARQFASPFDWLFSTPAMVSHVIASGGSELLDLLQVFKITDQKFGHTLYTPMLLDSMSRCHNRRRVNKQGVVFNHHDPLSDADRAYFLRALRRLRAALDSPLPKLCVLISAERRIAVDDHELDALLATLAAHSAPSAAIEVVAIRLLAPQSARSDASPANSPATAAAQTRLRCRRVHTDGHATLRCVDLACRANLTDSGLALSDADDMLDLAKACFGGAARLDAKSGRLVSTALASAADPAVGLETSDCDHVKPCGRMSGGWRR